MKKTMEYACSKCGGNDIRQDAVVSLNETLPHVIGYDDKGISFMDNVWCEDCYDANDDGLSEVIKRPIKCGRTVDTIFISVFVTLATILTAIMGYCSWLVFVHLYFN